MKKTIFAFIAFVVCFSFVLPVSAATTAPQMDFSCMAKITSERDGVIFTALDLKNESIKAAFKTRSEEHAAAWSKTTLKDVKQAILAANKKFNTTRIGVIKTYKASVNNAYKTFRTKKTECKAGAYTESGSSDLSI